MAAGAENSHSRVPAEQTRVHTYDTLNLVRGRPLLRNCLKIQNRKNHNLDAVTVHHPNVSLQVKRPSVWRSLLTIVLVVATGLGILFLVKK